MNVVTLSPAAQIALVVIAVLNVLFVGGLVAFIIIGVKEFQKLRAQAQPIIDRITPIMDRVPPIMDEAKPIVASVNPLINDNVKPILGNVQEITHKVSGIITDLGQHAHEIAETGEHTVKEITHRVEATGQVVAENVSKPVINVASFAAGLGRAFSVLKNYQKQTDDSRPHANGNGASSSGDGMKATANNTL
jgi:phage-related protein